MSYKKRRTSRTAYQKEECNCPTVNWAKAGESVGAGLGSLAKRGWSYLTGGGDYQLNKNSLIQGGGSTQQAVTIMPSGPREVTIRYREYLGDVITHPTVAGQFDVRAYPLNPGLANVFPWLSIMAGQFEQWTPNGIVFEFKSTSSEYVATQALGSIIMATEYDSLDTPFTDKQAMLNSAYASEAKPSQQLLHGIECAKQDNPNTILYCRRGLTVPTGGSIRDYDLGTFYIATQGGATANLNLGSLYVHYDITFRKETIARFLGAGAKMARYILNTQTSLNNGNLFNSHMGGQDEFGLTLSNNTITFPAWVNEGYFVVLHEIVGTGSTVVTVPTRTYVNAQDAEWSPGNGAMYGYNNGINNDRVTNIFRMRVTGSPASFTFSATAVWPGTTQRHTIHIMNVGNYGL